MKTVTDMPKDELQQKLQRHIDDAKVMYQTALLNVCIHGPSALSEYKRAAETFIELGRALLNLAAED